MDKTLCYDDSRLKISSDFLKRFFDIFFSGSILLLFSPLFLLIMGAIKLASPGAIFFSQTRLGLKGKEFTCYKFRTMQQEAEKKLQFILDTNPLLFAEWTLNQKLKRDPRIFRLGSLLRKFSLDEFPQFWNVLKGDLSIVGPRPYMLEQQKELGIHRSLILSVRPGLTGLWQTSGRSHTSFERRVELDAEYVRRKSFWLDLYLIAKTIPQLLFSHDAY